MGESDFNPEVLYDNDQRYRLIANLRGEVCLESREGDFRESLRIQREDLQGLRHHTQQGLRDYLGGKSPKILEYMAQHEIGEYEIMQSILCAALLVEEKKYRNLEEGFALTIVKKNTRIGELSDEKSALRGIMRSQAGIRDDF